MQLQTPYGLYCGYVAGLHDALSRPPSGPVADKYRVKRLSQSEFETVWQNWGRTPGLQDKWAARFSAGCVADAEPSTHIVSVSAAKRDADREAA